MDSQNQHDGQPRSARGRRERAPEPAFTLIEVLVVVAIIALLISILAPALSQARQLARSTTCQASVRQLGTGMNMYLDQYRCYPGHQFILAGDRRIRWFNAMSRLLRGYEVSSCPTVPDWDVGRNNSYGYNYKYLGSTRYNDVSPTAPWDHFPVKTLRAPSDTIAFGDSDGTGWIKPYMKGVNDKDMLGNHGYVIDPTHLPVWSEQTYNIEGDGSVVFEAYAWKNYRTYISTRHLGRSNLCWADGHVSPLRPKDVYRNNKYWNGLGGEDPVRDPHLEERFRDGEWRFPGI